MKEHPPTESPPPPEDLPSIWRQRAQLLSDFGDPNSGRLWALAATELEQALRVLGEDALTLVEAAALCGYSADHLGTLVRRGKIPNYGQRNAPRIRRADLPTKSTTSPGRPRRRKAADVDIDITDIKKKLLPTGR